MFLAIKYDLDNGKLRELLEQHGVSDVATAELISVYEKNQTSLRIKNLTTGLSLGNDFLVQHYDFARVGVAIGRSLTHFYTKKKINSMKYRFGMCRSFLLRRT